MNSSIRNGGVHGLVTAVAAAFVVSLLAVPAAMGKERGLDPWAYNVMHRTSEVITEHSAGQNVAQTGGMYGPLDPWAYNVIHDTPIALITEHSLGQDPNRAPIAAAGDDVPAAVGGSAFDWGDAGIGGAATLALVVLVAGAAALRHTSRRQEAHG